MPVYVINKHGQPLMPCTSAKARRLLSTGKACVKRRTPLTIQLRYGSSGYKQPIVLGVDAGSKTIGLSACSASKELFATEVKPRNDIVNLLTTRREFRRGRRNRKTRYRAPRFNNRTHSKHKGWLAPSVEVKIREHITPIHRVCKILPVTKIIVETAEFDLQLIKSQLNGLPPPVGTDYQHGEMFGFYNTRQYTLFRDGYRCRVCGSGAGKLYVTNAEGKATVSPEDSYTVCEKCAKLYSGQKFPIRKRRYWTHPTFMGIMRKTLMARLRSEVSVPVEETIGAITKSVREAVGLKKTHINDARCIAGHPKVRPTTDVYAMLPVRHHNRQLHRATTLKGGIRKNNQAAKYVKGFRLFDKVSYLGVECFVWARRTSGSFRIRTLDGAFNKDGVSYKKLQLLERSTNYLIQTKGDVLQ